MGLTFGSRCRCRTPKVKPRPAPRPTAWWMPPLRINEATPRRVCTRKRATPSTRNNTKQCRRTGRWVVMRQADVGTRAALTQVVHVALVAREVTTHQLRHQPPLRLSMRAYSQVVCHVWKSWESCGPLTTCPTPRTHCCSGWVPATCQRHVWEQVAHQTRSTARFEAG